MAVAALAAAVPFILRLNAQTTGWATFGILAAGAAASHTYTVRTAKDSSFHTSWVFLIPAAMLLPPELVALMGVVQHIPEWLKERYAWYIQSFNIANYTLGNARHVGRGRRPAGRDAPHPERGAPLGRRRPRRLCGRSSVRTTCCSRRC